MKRLLSGILILIAGLAVIESGCRSAGKQLPWPTEEPGRLPRPPHWQSNELFRQSGYWFRDDRVRELRITIGAKLFTDIVMARFRVDGEKVYALADAVRVDGDRIEHVGIRTRGGTSGKNHKRQFKLTFDCDEAYTEADTRALTNRPELKRRRFHGVEKINLRASQNDPTIIREKLASWVFQEAGVPAPRVGFARVYINGNYWGLYLLTEQIDETLLLSRYGEEKGSLYKGSHGRARFTPKHADRGFEVKEKNPRQPKLHVFFHALESIRRAPEKLARFVSIHNVLNYLAAASVAGHWDSFAVLGNNDYLYQHSDGKFRIICWDMDNTFGSGSGWGFPMLKRDIFNFNNHSNQDNLFGPLLGHEEWRQLYVQKLKRLVQRCSRKKAFARIKQYRNLIREAVLEDPRKHYDWRMPDRATGNQTWQQGFYRKPESWQGRGFGNSNLGLKGWINGRIRFIKKAIREEEKG